MKNAILFSLLVGISTFALAERITSQTVVCYPTKKVITGLTSEGEEPMLMGQSVEKDNVVIWVNPKTKAWSITRTSPKSEETCVIEIGESLRPFQSQQQKSKHTTI